jgi:hypothetical protein
MTPTNRETWGLIHGLILGGFFLLAFAGGLAELYALRARWETDEGIGASVRRLTVGFWVMAVAAWATVVTGTWIVYPWYREKLAGADNAGCQGADIPIPGKCSPRDFLTSNVSGDTPTTAGALHVSRACAASPSSCSCSPSAPQPWRACSARSSPRSRRSNEEGGHDNYRCI